MPETSFTRTISNPEVVMKRRRQQKLEKRMQEFRSSDGRPDSGNDSGLFATFAFGLITFLLGGSLALFTSVDESLFLNQSRENFLFDLLILKPMHLSC